MSRFLKNVAWLQAGLILTSLVAFLISSTLYRELGADLYGHYAALFVLYNTVGLLLFFDPGIAMVHRVAAEATRLRATATEGLGLSLLSALAQGLVLGALGPWVLELWLGNNSLAACAHWLALLPLLNAPIQWALNIAQGQERMKGASGLLLMQNLGRPVGALLGWRFGLLNPRVAASEPTLLAWIIGGLVLIHVPAALAALWHVRRHHGDLFREALRNPRLPSGSLLHDTLVISTDKKTTDQFDLLPRQLLGFYCSPVVLAHFDVIMKLVGLLQSLVDPVSRALLPNLSRSASTASNAPASVLDRNLSMKALKEVSRKVHLIATRGFVMGLIMALGMALFTWHIILPHPQLYGMDTATRLEVASAGVIILLMFPTFGIGVTNNALSLILGRVKSMFHQKLWLMLALAPAAWWLARHHGLFGACVFVLLYKAALRFGAAIVLHRDLSARLKS